MINQLTIDLLKINKFIEQFESGKIKLVDYIGNVYSKNNNFFYKIILSKVLDNSPLRPFFVDWLSETEKIFPNCSLLLLKNLYRLYLGNYQSADLNKRIIGKKADLENLLKKYIDHNSLNLFMTLLDIAGPDALLNIINTSNVKVEIHKENLTKFEKIKCHEELSNILFSTQLKSKRDIIFVAIDGFLERDTDLQYLYEESQQNQNKIIVILCRGTNLQCVSQIKRNIVYTKIPVLIYECPFTNEDPSKFEDLCKCLATEVVRIEDGDPTILQIKRKLKKLENIVLGVDSIQFACDPYISQSMINEINDLISKKPEYQEYLNTRKKRIKSKKVNILIPKNKKNLTNDLKTAIFIYNSISKYGFIEIESDRVPTQLCRVADEYAKSFYEKIQQISVTINLKSQKENKKWRKQQKV